MRDVSVLIAVRGVLGGLAALAVSLIAWRGRALGRSGVVAASFCGLLASIGGWQWAILLVVYFVGATLVSRAARADSVAAVERIVAKGGRRDAIQVIANGGLFSVAAALTTVVPNAVLAAAALGALAASSADSWATEIGTRLGGRPRLITSGVLVAAGQSGGVTAAGLVGALAGAVLVGTTANALGFPRGLVLASIPAGLAGSLIDSLLGATVQERRWCDRCGEPTERTVHCCGSPARIVGGIRQLDNDVVNILSTAAGFLAAMIIYGSMVKSGSWGAID